MRPWPGPLVYALGSPHLPLGPPTCPCKPSQALWSSACPSLAWPMPSLPRPLFVFLSLCVRGLSSGWARWSIPACPLTLVLLQSAPTTLLLPISLPAIDCELAGLPGRWGPGVSSPSMSLPCPHGAIPQRALGVSVNNLNRKRVAAGNLRSWQTNPGFAANPLWPRVDSNFFAYLPHLKAFCYYCSVVQSCLTLCDPMDCSTPGLPVLHHLQEFAQTPVHKVSDAIQPSHPLLSPSLPTFHLSQHQGLFQWVTSSYQVAKVLEIQLQHQSFQLIFRIDFL